MSSTSAFAPSEDMRRKLELIGELAQGDCSLAQLAEATSIPEVTIKRQIASLRRDFAMDIRFARSGASRGAVGNYQLLDWGLVDKQTFRRLHGVGEGKA